MTARRVIIGGASGLIGQALATRLSDSGYDVIELVRGQVANAAQISWDPSAESVDSAQLENAHAIISLNGAGIADKRWTTKRKQVIESSRVDSVTTLARAISELNSPPKVFLTASAIGYYQPTHGKIVNESSASSEGFLSSVCKKWEEATAPAHASGCRIVHTRFGVVLSTHGGALKKMLFPFKLGVGGKIGDGKQFISWISLPDAVSAIQFCIENDALKGAVNLVSPKWVDNEQFSKTLAGVLRRPCFLPVPAPAVKILFGEMGEMLLLDSVRVESKKLSESNFTFEHKNIEAALDDLISNNR